MSRFVLPGTSSDGVLDRFLERKSSRVGCLFVNGCFCNWRLTGFCSGVTFGEDLTAEDWGLIK